MARKSVPAEETARLEIVCNNFNECDVTFTGNTMDMTAALAGLMAKDEEENAFRTMMTFAIELVLELDKKSKKK